MLKNILSKNNINICKKIINGNSNISNNISFTTKSYFKIHANQCFMFSEANPQNFSKGKYSQRKNNHEYSKDNEYHGNSDNFNPNRGNLESLNKKSYYNRGSDKSNKKNNTYNSKGRSNKFSFRENDSIIKPTKTIDITSEPENPYKNSAEAKKDSAIARKIIENPSVQMKISEDDLHAALAKTSDLPEDIFKRLIEELKTKCEEVTENSRTLQKAETKNSNNQILKKEFYLMSENKKFLNEFEREIEFNITRKFKLFLNKSLVNIAKTVKRNPDLFRNNKRFWLALESEVMERCNSLTNEQITDFVSAFVKADIPEVKLFDEIEDTIIETTVPFSPDQLERIFNSYCSQNKGTTSFLKHLTRKYMKNVDILDSWRLVKFITDLHNHPHTIKGDFGHVKELESLIIRDIENRKIRFDNLVHIANCIFTNNLCSNKIQTLVENELIDKIADFNRIDFDVGKFIKLIKSLNGYYIKNEELCDRIKNVLETYLNAYMKLQQESFYEGERRKKQGKNQIQNRLNNESSNYELQDGDITENSMANKGRKAEVSKNFYKKASKENEDDKIKYENDLEKDMDAQYNSEFGRENKINENQNKIKKRFESKSNHDKAEESDSEPDIIVENIDPSELENLNSQTEQKKSKTINYEFMDRYHKIIANVSVIFWSLSKNEKFRSLKNTREDYKYFFERMKETTLKNIEFYNEREITFILKAFRDLNIPLTKSENKNFIKKISTLENFTLHDRIVLLGIFLKNDMGGSLDLILKFIEKVKQSFNSLTYSDLIDYLELLNSVPNLINKVLNENKKEKVSFIEKRFAPIMRSIEIEKFCKLFLIVAKFQVLFSESFLNNLNQNLIERMNEIPKEYFCSVMQNAVNLSSNSAAAKLLDILEDLSHFENIKENFVKFEDLNNLLWSALSFSRLKVSEVLEHEEEVENLNSELALKLNNFSKSLITNLIELEGSVKFEESGKINLMLNKDIGHNHTENNIKEALETNEENNIKSSEAADNKIEDFEEKLNLAYKNLNEKIIRFVNVSFNLDTLIQKELDSNSNKNKNFFADKTSIVVLYFQTIQLLLHFAKNHFYHNLKAENLIAQNSEISSFLQNKFNGKKNKLKNDEFISSLDRILNENFTELKENILLSLSENSIKSDVSILDNFVLIDAASQNEKSFVEDVLQNVDTFFARKPNCSIYQNMIDDYFNAINISVIFEIPKLEENEYVSGIDANKYAVVYLNENYFSNFKSEKSNKKGKMIRFYDNRISLLSELFEWKVILINKNFSENEIAQKQEFLKEKFGFDMQDEENIKIKILDRNQINEDAKRNNKNDESKRKEAEVTFGAEKKPKYNLTKQILIKKQNKKD